MQATKQLPSNYQQRASLDISRDKKTMIALNLAGMLLLIPFGWLFLYLFALIRPDTTAFSLEVSGLGVFLVGGLLLLVVVGIVLLHELVHGLFIWLYTGSRLHLGLGASYAYAAAPDWYIPLPRQI